MAISLAGDKFLHYEAAAAVTLKLVEHFIVNPIACDMILNVNVPDIPLQQLKGLQLTRLGTRHIAEPTIASADPRGNKLYWIGPPGSEADAGPGTDFYAINSNYVSLTPSHTDLTHYKMFDQL